MQPVCSLRLPCTLSRGSHGTDSELSLGVKKIQRRESTGLTIRTNAKKVHPVGHDFEATGRHDFPGQVFQAGQFRIDDFFALHADQMRMRIRLVAVIAIAALGETKLEHLSQRFDQHDIAINGRQAHGGEVVLQLFVYGIDTGMPLARDQNPGDRQTLGGEFMMVLTKFLNDRRESFFWVVVCHCRHFR